MLQARLFSSSAARRCAARSGELPSQSLFGGFVREGFVLFRVPWRRFSGPGWRPVQKP